MTYELRATMAAAGVDPGPDVAEQHRVRRPLITRAISDLITVGIKS